MIAKPLPTREDAATSKKTKKPKKKTAGDTYKDDTPKEFARMMSRFAKVSNPSSRATSSGPNDDGKKKQQQQQQGRKRKRGDAGDSNEKDANNAGDKANVPKILPGERMSDFAARVDQALPLSGITKKSGFVSTDPNDVALRKLREDRQTRHEKKLRRLQAGWREEEAKIREKEEEEREEREEKEEELNEMWKMWEAEAGGPLLGGKKKKGKAIGGKKKKKKNGGAGGEVDSDSDDADPWAKLNRKKKAHASRPINPLESVQAPPEKLVKPREIFKVHGMGGAKVDVANVPAAAGSLRRREELASERKNIVEEYRKLMASKRG